MSKEQKPHPSLYIIRQLSCPTAVTVAARGLTIITMMTLTMMVLAMMAMIAMTSDDGYDYDEYDNDGNLSCDGSGSGSFFTTFQRAEQVLQRIL